VIVMILPDDPIVAARVGDGFVVTSMELAGLFAFAIERGDDLFVFAGLRVLSIGHGQFRFDLDIASARLNCKRYASLRNFYFPPLRFLASRQHAKRPVWRASVRMT